MSNYEKICSKAKMDFVTLSANCQTVPGAVKGRTASIMLLFQMNFNPLG